MLAALGRRLRRSVDREIDALRVVRSRKLDRFAVVVDSIEALSGLSPRSIGSDVVVVASPTEEKLSKATRLGWSARKLTESYDLDALIVLDGPNFPQLMRAVAPSMRRGVTVIPGQADWVVDPATRNGQPDYIAWNTSAAANYAARCNLRGHYLEFGTFWGRSFFRSFFEFRHFLQGRFCAFDSFEGLSEPLRLETEYTGGDFSTGEYACNVQSFEAISELVGMDPKRLTVIPGFFDKSLVAATTMELVEPRSVSVCYIDCDLRAPTELVLDFVSPLLEDGALVYFDDWRLCRASREVGERAAALGWLERNPDFELTEFVSSHWQNQWFIFQRRR